MIIKKVPYFDDKEEKYGTCQGLPTALMVLKRYKPRLHISIEDLYGRMDYKKGQWFFETYLAQLLDETGIPAKIFGNETIRKIGEDSVFFHDFTGLDFLNRQHRNSVGVDRYDSSVSHILSRNLYIFKRVSILFIKKQLDKNNLVIPILNRNILTNEEGYKGHFTLIKGYDKREFVCNDAFLGKDFRLSYSMFTKSFYNPHWNTPENKSLHSTVVVGNV